MAEISSVEKLRLVRELDIFHPWQSLDEERYCRRCGATFSGHEIKVITNHDGVNHRLECPTDGCPSVPIEWIVVEPTEFPRASLPVRHPQYRPGLFGFLRVPQII